jgi:hypothetical protein
MEVRHLSVCQTCVWRFREARKWTTLTGYCISQPGFAFRCDVCNNPSDLMMVNEPLEESDANKIQL